MLCRKVFFVYMRYYMKCNKKRRNQTKRFAGSNVSGAMPGNAARTAAFRCGFFNFFAFSGGVIALRKYFYPVAEKPSLTEYTNNPVYRLTGGG